ncbi:right-handed parallel beta-helix repeat-containing protein [Streptomyces hyaluromycini]|uniref:Right-handed parallel beta-helix repeat-containing protein n=1 Tax=Streptomyces hyaluromycini TaxID=1377993 RepID=A0ABV1X9X3_9ACTN
MTTPLMTQPRTKRRPGPGTRLRRAGAGAVAVLGAFAVAATLLLGTSATAHADGAGDKKQKLAAEDAETQAALVADEDHRLNQVRAFTSVAPLQSTKWTVPYRLDTDNGYTLVLTQRSNAYTIADLLKLAPQTFLRRKDGSYLLTENIYLNVGAKLKLSNPGGLTLRMASNRTGFVSIVSFGGELTLQGTAQAPLTITSWDPQANKADSEVRDGRAYIRTIGGQFEMTHAKLANLGFWSGRTGGLSLTGTDRPNTGSLEDMGQVHGKTARERADQQGNQDDQNTSSGDVTAMPSGALTTPDARFSTGGLSYVSGSITHSTITGNAFGIFISSATGIEISDTTVADSLEDGVVMHRFVSSSLVQRTVAKDNGGDGFILSRATQQVRVSGCTAEGNGGNGYTLSGKPLADGPSASGQAVDSYGSNSVANSVAKDNGRYGVEVLGGFDVGVQNNRIEGGDMGIVARLAADKVSITGNRLTGQNRQGISVRDGVTDATVTGNIIDGPETGVYVRDSAAEIRGNTVQDATNHGVSLVGGVDGTTVSYNVIGGVGPSALDSSRSHGGASIKENQTFAWYDTSSFWVKVKHYASPMTLLWTGILLLILFSAAMGRRRRRASGRGAAIVHPYSDKAPLPAPPPDEIAVAGRRREPVMSE